MHHKLEHALQYPPAASLLSTQQDRHDNIFQGMQEWAPKRDRTCRCSSWLLILNLSWRVVIVKPVRPLTSATYSCRVCNRHQKPSSSCLVPYNRALCMHDGGIMLSLELTVLLLLPPEQALSCNLRLAL